ncbi:MAG TPA: hypothetical protein VGM90_17645 [Kofleriaceae bacterium]|jgi:hypothetical protein
MSSVAEIAIDAYAAAFQEPDEARRATLLEKCWAVEGRLVTGGRVIQGRAALSVEMARFANDPRGPKIVLRAPPDVQGNLFRLTAHAVYSDGTLSPVSFDAGELDADGRIKTILTFRGP